MAEVTANGVRIAYEIDGPDDGAAVLLIHGVGAQLTRWPAGLVDALAAAGFRVIRFDNRDVGLSTHMHAAGMPDLAAILAATASGEAPPLPYGLADMAEDVTGLLDALHIASAHVVGVSLGGMIAQMLAICHPSRMETMALVMTQSGNPALPPSNPQAIAALAAPAPDPKTDLDAYLAHSITLNRTLGSPAYPTAGDVIRDFARQSAARAHDPAGALRQLAAGRASADRRAALATVAIPTVVIHGVDDPLIPVAAGEELARTVPQAWYLGVAGMGHDLPAQLCPLFASVIVANCRRAMPGTI